MQNLYPFTVAKFTSMDNIQIAFLDMITTRFSKLQDIIGAKIFHYILEILAEDANSFIDKLNRLEKLGYIDNVDWWLELRAICNQITHDYPNNYTQLVKDFNLLFPKTKELLNYWDRLKKELNKL